ncbi:hypothetical protein GQ53DRAFT_303962 [Thozetella sp. PMI_491]|nr:hypothetical protein GQ53DRAFT_303962 [Thozetella sp. PMI_491]
MDTHYIANTIVGTLVPRNRLENCTRDADGFIVNDDKCFVPFWYTRTGIIVKWSLFLGFTVIIGLYILIGYIHAKRRLRKGLVPLAYHRWLVSRSALARVDPRYAYPQAAGYQPYNPNSYGMNWVPPPPVYDPNATRPPMYNGPGPEGSTKVDPSQWMTEPTRRPADQQAEQYAPPTGPPPSALRPEGTGNSNPFRG